MVEIVVAHTQVPGGMWRNPAPASFVLCGQEFIPDVFAPEDKLGAMLNRLLNAEGPTPPHLLAPNPQSDNCDEDHHATNSQLRANHEYSVPQWLLIDGPLDSFTRNSSNSVGRR